MCGYGCGGSASISSTPAVIVKPAVGEAGLVLVEYTGASDRPQFGPVTGSYYPFQQRPRLYVDARDLSGLEGVRRV
jgi:hypothetical protein